MYACGAASRNVRIGIRRRLRGTNRYVVHLSSHPILALCILCRADRSIDRSIAINYAQIDSIVANGAVGPFGASSDDRSL